MNNSIVRSSISLSIFCLLLLTVWSCKSTKIFNEEKKEERNSSYLLDKLQKEQADFDWFSAKAKIRYDGEDQGLSVSSTIRMRKDSVVWMNVKKFGLEIVRVLIKRDSVYVMDKFNREYYVEDISYIEKAYNIPADLGTIQDIIMGKAVFLTRDNLKSKLLNNSYQIVGQNTQRENQYWLNGTSLLLERMVLRDKVDERTINLDLQDYKDLDDDQKFSYLRKLNMKSQDTGNTDIEIKFSSVEINVPKNIRFEIPRRYKRVD